MNQNAKRVTLSKEHAYVSKLTAETCSGGKARSYMEITAPRNTRLYLPRITAPKMKLYDGTGAQVERSTLVFYRKLRPNDRKPVYLADFGYNDHYDVDAGRQGSLEYRESLKIDLGRDIVLNPHETLSIEIIGPDAVDWSNQNTVIEFAVAEEVM